MTVKWLMLKDADPSKVTFIETPLGQMSDVMRGSSVDGAALPEPMMSAIIKAGNGRLVSYMFDSFPDDTITTLSGVTRDWASRNPTLVAAYREAIAEAEAFVAVKANQPEAQLMIAEMTGMKPEIVASIPFPKLYAGLTVGQIKWWVDTMNEQKLLRTNVDPAKLLYGQ
jgi:ABC-type nitrate/sulfonate/bicarbonate transport system substrate-binding protein